MSILNNASIGLLLIRIVLGLVFVIHGIPKLKDDKWANFMATFGIPKPVAVFLAILEVVFGLTLLLGLYTRISGLIAFLFMVAAIILVHGKHGFYVNKNGFEYCLVLAVVSLALVFSGAGKYSLDAKLKLIN